MSDEQRSSRGDAEVSGPATGTATSAITLDTNAVPPAGEDIHLPGGTPIPLAIAVGITLALVGTTTSWLWTGIGVVIFMAALGLWIRDTRREVAHLPDDLDGPHSH